LEEIEFWKMNGSGNDFLLIDNRSGRVKEEQMATLATRACRRRESVGADGAIFVVPSDRFDFRWRFFNADGSEAEMCGNGGRCVARFALLMGIAGPKMTFETIAGPVSAEVNGRVVKVHMPDPHGLKTDIALDRQQGWISVDFVNTGVPHTVVHVSDLSPHPVIEQGRVIRYHPLFAPAGTNADFISIKEKNLIEVRTYERGVEDETLACGTGAMASALVAAARGKVKSPVAVKTRGGDVLTIHFRGERDAFHDLWLEGSTSIVCRAKLHEEAL
jgi:diaminopimelate epimerase